ncbi:hypothetical protein AVEN_175538-1 [Araneus ventricosus]|uniref:Uncharacterized protein n=1 Tax=Araneus ventricosus TaxID=182803 RepID=A0A4Y2CPP5_ARAVE|nr:hypothetical protein AVEN_175538-1 [Araneus ventricosus]
MKVSDSEKKKIAAFLMKCKVNEKSLPTGIPIFPALNHTTKLHQLVGPKSWLIFSSVEPRWEWLKNNPWAWEEDFRFKEMKTFIKNLKVVNVKAERG